MIAAPRDPHEEEQARLQENLFYTNLSSLQPKTNAKFWLNRYEVNDRLNSMLRRFFNAVHFALRIKMTTLRSKCSSRLCCWACDGYANCFSFPKLFSYGFLAV